MTLRARIEKMLNDTHFLQYISTAMTKQGEKDTLAALRATAALLDDLEGRTELIVREKRQAGSDGLKIYEYPSKAEKVIKEVLE